MSGKWTIGDGDFREGDEAKTFRQGLFSIDPIRVPCKSNGTVASISDCFIAGSMCSRRVSVAVSVAVYQTVGAWVLVALRGGGGDKEEKEELLLFYSFDRNCMS